jgi:hypothetical protein
VDDWYVVPKGTVVHTCATIDGQQQHRSSPLEDDLIVRYRGEGDALTVDATLPLDMGLSGGSECTEKHFRALVFMHADPDGMPGDTFSCSDEGHLIICTTVPGFDDIVVPAELR